MANETLAQPPTPATVGVGSKNLLGAVAVLASRLLHGRNYSDMDKTERALGHALSDAHFGGFGNDGYWRHAAPPAPNADLSHGAAGGSQQHNAPTPAPLAQRNG